jgi:hypothetical protein
MYWAYHHALAIHASVISAAAAVPPHFAVLRMALPGSIAAW